MSSPDTNNSNPNGRNARQRGLHNLPRSFVPMDQLTFPATQPRILSLDELKDPNVPDLLTIIAHCLRIWKQRIWQPKF